MSVNNVLLIINPGASKGKGGEKAKKIEAIFKERGVSCTVSFTKGKGDAENLALKGATEGYKTIVVAGGDGSVNEVINGLMRSGCADKVRMGIIPIGRGNDFAWVCGIPRDIRKAIDLIISGEGKKTDVGFCYGPDKREGMYFLNGTGFGFEPMVNFKAMEYKRINGMPSYVLAFLKILSNPPSGYNVSIIVDGNKTSLKTQQISVANGIRMGSAFKMTPRAKIDDGKIDLMYTNRIFKGLSLVLMVITFLRGAHVRDKKNFSYMNAREVSIIADSPEMQIHCDGEVYSKKSSEAHIKILPSAISLYR